MAFPRRPVAILAPAVAALLLWGWLFVTGTILVVDRSGTVARAEVITGWGVRPLHRLPGGIWVGLPGPDGAVRLTCRDGSRREIGYVSSAVHTRVRVTPGGLCGLARELV